MLDGNREPFLLKTHLSTRNYPLRINLYSYGYNNPIKNLDPLGLCPIEQCWKCILKSAELIYLPEIEKFVCECQYKCHLFERKWNRSGDSCSVPLL